MEINSLNASRGIRASGSSVKYSYDKVIIEKAIFNQESIRGLIFAKN